MDVEHTQATERLWTPWRMQYIGGQAREEGCIFCNRLASDHDLASLILYRGEHVFVIMNLFPYNTGHVMLVPNTHAADPSELTLETLREMGETLPTITAALKRVLGCDGFNVGLNIGNIAGAGVADHLHEHIVPRWTGDANFMPILASTMVLPEMIPVTYAKIRAEIERTRSHALSASFVVFDEDDRILLRNGGIPSVTLQDDTPVWKSVVDAMPAEVTSFELAGWAGADSTRAGINAPLALTFRALARNPLAPGWTWTPRSDSSLDEPTRTLAHRAALQRAPIS